MPTPVFTEVKHVASKIAIIGTGSSLEGVRFSFADDVKTIAVNSAIKFYKDMDFWFTLDPSPSNLEIMKNRVFGVAYYAAVPDDFKVVTDYIRHLRRVTGQGHGRYLTKGGLSNDKRAIHTGNSAWGALQLAVHMGATNIALFGVDGYGKYLYGGAPRNLSMMPELFASAVDELKQRNINVVNGSVSSLVDCFPRMTPQEAMTWLNQQN